MSCPCESHSGPSQRPLSLFQTLDEVRSQNGVCGYVALHPRPVQLDAFIRHRIEQIGQQRILQRRQELLESQQRENDEKEGGDKHQLHEGCGHSGGDVATSPSCTQKMPPRLINHLGSLEISTLSDEAVFLLTERDSAGYTPLHVAARLPPGPVTTELCRRLICGCPYSAFVNAVTGGLRQTALHRAVQSKNVDVVTLLLDKTAASKRERRCGADNDRESDVDDDVDGGGDGWWCDRSVKDALGKTAAEYLQDDAAMELRQLFC